MDATGNKTTCFPTPSLLSASLSTTSLNTAVVSPCAACKILRRKCAENCVLAPYFPPSEPLKFITAHRVFGASNIIKFLQELPECQRADAVSSMVYEANARVRDPVYGCAGAICHLQKQVNDLQLQLAMTQAELIKVECQNANLTSLYMNLGQSPENLSENSSDSDDNSDNMLIGGCFLGDNNTGCTTWEALWS